MNSSKSDYIFEPFKVTEIKYRGNVVPRPRSGHRIVCDDENIYCFGGYNPAVTNYRDRATWSPDRPLFKELWSFSISSRKWKLHRVLENMPEELASNAMYMHGKYLMIFGGTGNPFGDRCSNDVTVWKTDCGDARFKILDVTGSRPPGQYGQAILCHDGYFYAIGGTDGFAYNCDIYRLDLSTNVWEPVFVGSGLEGEPHGRYRHEVALVDNKLYILGGGTGNWAFELMEIPMFNLENKQWTILTPKRDETLKEPSGPLPRKCHSAVQLNTPDGVQVFVAGGSDGQSVFDDIWRLDLSNMQWNLMQKSILPHPLYFHSSTITSYGCMYVFGGIEPKNEAICRNNFMYKMWLTIPKLSEICWEALLHFHPNLEQVEKSSLLNIGVPVRFLDRLNR